MLRWYKSEYENQYFENNEENEAYWTEYQNGELFAEYEEINRRIDTNGELEVLILRTDGVYGKLTSESAFWGDEENRINKWFCSGGWSIVRMEDETQYCYSSSSSSSSSSSDSSGSDSSDVE